MELLALKSAQEKLSQKGYRVGTLALNGELMVAANDVWLTVEEFQALADGTITVDELFRKHRG